MFPVISAVLDDQYDAETRRIYLELAQQFAAVSSDKSVDQLLAKIKSCLSASNSRLEGLVLLDCSLPLLEDEQISENILFWIQTCVKQLQEKAEIVQTATACKTLTKLFELLPRFNDVHRDVSVSLVAGLIEALTKKSPVKSNELLAVFLDCLYSCAVQFPGPCGAKKHLIESFVMKHVDSATDSSLKPLAKCLSKLSSCGGSGLRGINFQTQWKENFQKALATVNSLLTVYKFAGVEFADDMQFGDKKMNLFSHEIELNNDIFTHATAILRRIKFSVSILCRLLTEEFPVEVSVPIPSVLSIVSKMCSINCNEIKNKHSIESSVISFIIPKIHQLALKVLEALINCCRLSCTPHSKFMNKLLLRSLEWSGPKHFPPTAGCKKAFSEFRQQVYCVLQLWFVTAGFCCNFSTKDAEELINECFADVKPIENKVKLQTSGKNKNKNKTSNKPSRNLTDSVDSDLYLQSIKCLRCLINSRSTSIAASDISNLHYQVVDLLLNIYRNRFSPPTPYQDFNCRKELLHLLLVLVLNTSNSPSNPLQASVVIFSNADKFDGSCLVKQFCRESISVINSLIHPKMPVQVVGCQMTSDLVSVTHSESTEIETSKNEVEVISDSREESESDENEVEVIEVSSSLQPTQIKDLRKSFIQNSAESSPKQSEVAKTLPKRTLEVDFDVSLSKKVKENEVTSEVDEMLKDFIDV